MGPWLLAQGREGLAGSKHAKFDLAGYATDSPWKSMDRGELMFRGQCMNCHTVGGYRSMRRLMVGRDRKSIENMINMLHDPPATSPYRNFMPQVAGTTAEIDDLVGYLDRPVNRPVQAVTRVVP